MFTVMLHWGSRGMQRKKPGGIPAFLFFDGVIKTPIFCVAAVFRHSTCLHARKNAPPCIAVFLLSPYDEVEDVELNLCAIVASTQQHKYVARNISCPPVVILI